MAKGPLRHFFSFSFPTASLESLLCLIRLFSAIVPFWWYHLVSQAMHPTLLLQERGMVPSEKLGRGVRPASQNPYPIYDLAKNRYPIYEQTGWKTLAFGTTHTCIAHIRKYPPRYYFQMPNPPYSLLVSLFRSRYFSIFSHSFSYALWSQGEAISIIIIIIITITIIIIIIVMTVKTYGCHMDPYSASLGRRT